MPSPTSVPRLPAPEGPDIEGIYRRYGRDLERWAARLGGPLVDAEEVVQEVLTIVDRKLRGFRPDAKLTTWLYKITQNVATSRRRRERFRRWLRGLPADYAADLAVPGPSVVEEMQRREAAADVYAALDQLDEKHRSVVILFEIEGLSGEEIAELTGTPLGTVWVRLKRARERFRRHYERLMKGRVP